MKKLLGALTLLLALDARAKILALDSVSIPVADLDRSIAFYTGVLDFKASGTVEIAGDDVEKVYGVFGVRARLVRLELGDESLQLVQFLAPEGRAYPDSARSNDRSFQHVAIIVSDMSKAYARLRDHHVRHASSGPQRLPDWNPNAGGIEAFYFKDPDGHPLEILHFPDGKGAAKWHAQGRLFLGIDHTAIVVGATDTSTAFYGAALGMRKAGESENYGTEQEHLNNVFGARLRITAMRLMKGPGVEFLEYLAPQGGREAAADTQANDLVAVTTVLVTDDADGDAAALRKAGYEWVSPGAVALSDRALGLAKAATIKDPDGHFIRLVQEGASK
ncbi:MAG TPA: VOC family protein [Candidatus Polarisedimenticolaceae bacterium]|nr:VOC family protein [Candidatus Polarisedimenticolaceae bacterium]